jgi:hypothetical protein
VGCNAPRTGTAGEPWAEPRAGVATPGSVGAGQGDATDSDIRLVKGRLVALEHVLGAIGALLEAGAVQEALNLVRGWRRRG